MKFQKYLDFLQSLRNEMDEGTAKKIEMKTEKILKYYCVKLDQIFVDALDTVTKEQIVKEVLKNDIDTMTAIMREYLFFQDRLMEKEVIEYKDIRPFDEVFQHLIETLKVEVNQFLLNFRNQLDDEPYLKVYYSILEQVFKAFLKCVAQEIAVITSGDFLLNAVVTSLPVELNNLTSTYTAFTLEELNEKKPQLNDEDLKYVNHFVTFINIFSNKTYSAGDIVGLYKLRNQ